MNAAAAVAAAAASASASPSSLALLSFNVHRRRRKIPTQSLSLLVISSSFSRPRPHRPRRPRSRPFNPNPEPSLSTSSDDRDISLSIDLDSISDRATSALARFARSSRSNIRRFLASGIDAFDDLRTSVRIDPGHQVVFACRRSSILFVTNLFVFGLIVFVAVRAVAGLGFRRRWGFGNERAVVRRDRSLGGRVMVVGARSGGENERGGSKNFRVSSSPVSDVEGIERRLRESMGEKWMGKKEEKLPEWWPESVSKPGFAAGNDGLKREADQLIRAIMDNRLSGKDYKDDDIVQLRQICKISGARVSFGTDNVRDSFYRASVDFVLNICCRVMQPATTVQIHGEEARQFISGLADNIGLENIRAARIIRAAVAARTRSGFLQSWAFEIQGKRSEALEDLSKICQIFQLFPPEEDSPEMEMVAGGLKKTLGIGQRRHLLSLFRRVCGPDCQRIAKEALGLIYDNGYEGGDDGSHTNSQLS